MSVLTSPEILTPSHLHLLSVHFLKLSPSDRKLRFKTTCTDETLLDYLKKLDFVQDKILGILSDNSQLVAVGHLCFYKNKVADISLSVNQEYRRSGCAKALIDHAKLLSQEMGYTKLKISSLKANISMISLASKHGFLQTNDMTSNEWEGTFNIEKAQSSTLEGP